MNLELLRFCYSPQGTFGVLRAEDLLLYTVERPWINNEPNISCIPRGNYPLVPQRFNKGGYDTVEIKGVPDRTKILIHRANTYEHVQGCIGVGWSIGCVDDMWAVTYSAHAFEDFYEWYLIHKPQRITINHTGMPVHKFP